MERKAKKLFFAFKVVLSCMIIWVIFKGLDIRTFVAGLGNIDFKLYLVANVLAPISIFARAMRFYLIVNKDGRKLGIGNTMVVLYISAALNMVMPAGMGDIAKSYFAYMIAGDKERMLSASLVDKLIAMLTVFMLGAIGLFYFGYILFAFCSAAVALLLTGILFIPDRIPWKTVNWILKPLHTGVDEEKMCTAFNLGSIIKLATIGISMAAWLCVYVLFYLVCRTCYIDVGFVKVLLASPIITIGRLFPFTLNGLGIQEGMLAYMFRQIGVANDQVLQVALYGRIMLFIIPAVIGFFLMWSVKKEFSRQHAE